LRCRVEAKGPRGEKGERTEACDPQADADVGFGEDILRHVADCRLDVQDGASGDPPNNQGKYTDGDAGRLAHWLTEEHDPKTHRRSLHADNQRQHAVALDTGK
jgi:hypothetical protein